MGSSKSKESSNPEIEVEKTNTNFGLVNVEENNVALLGPVEIALIVLVTFAIGFVLRYCQKKCKKSTIRSVQEGLTRHQDSSNISRPFPAQPSMQSSMPMQVPMPLAVTFQEPGCRVVATVPTNGPTAPCVQPVATSSVGLWDMCK